VKYDDASWHYRGDFPKDLPHSAGATHLAMFVSWAVLNGLGSELHEEEAAEDRAALKSRRVTPVGWFVSACDEKFTSEDLTDEGHCFVEAYYCDAQGLRDTPGSYLADYSDRVAAVTSLYHVPASWASYDALAPIIQARFDAWKRARSPATPADPGAPKR
jgi:hypothetical protein